MSNGLESILAGFGWAQPSWLMVPETAAKTVAAAAPAAAVSPWFGIGEALLGLGTGYFEYKTAEKLAKAQMEMAETQLAMVEAASKLKLPAGVTTAPVYQPTATPTAATGFMPTTTAAPTMGRLFPTPGDTMGIFDAYLQSVGLAPMGVAPTTGAVTTTAAPVAGATGVAGLPLPGAGLPSPAGMFQQPGVTVRPVPEIMAVNPATGKIHAWKHMGRPVLYQGDLSACRRVQRVARRVAKAMPKRRGSP